MFNRPESINHEAAYAASTTSPSKIYADAVNVTGNAAECRPYVRATANDKPRDELAATSCPRLDPLPFVSF